MNEDAEEVGRLFGEIWLEVALNVDDESRCDRGEQTRLESD